MFEHDAKLPICEVCTSQRPVSRGIAVSQLIHQSPRTKRYIHVDIGIKIVNSGHSAMVGAQMLHQTLYQDLCCLISDAPMLCSFYKWKCFVKPSVHFDKTFSLGTFISSIK